MSKKITGVRSSQKTYANSTSGLFKSSVGTQKTKSTSSSSTKAPKAKGK